MNASRWIPYQQLAHAWLPVRPTKDGHEARDLTCWRSLAECQAECDRRNAVIIGECEAEVERLTRELAAAQSRLALATGKQH